METAEVEVKTPLYSPSPVDIRQQELQQEEAEDKREIAELNESLFWGRNDAIDLHGHKKRWGIDLSVDSYIWCFTGGRGAGKTTAMTFSAAQACYLYDMRLVSNYPLEFRLLFEDGTSKVYRAEPLDLYKLMCFDAEYRHCLILLDEAPDVISHMAAMTWKNRLIAIFTRQLRKNRNSLMMCAQDFGLIDKSMRGQVDILVPCHDASRMYGWASSERGKMILYKLRDNSGMWTGKTWQQEYDEARWKRRSCDPGEKYKLYPRVMWGDEKHKPVYDTYYVQDVWESLRKVDMRMMTYSVGKDNLADSDFKERLVAMVDSLPKGKIIQTEFWDMLGFDENEKQAASKLFRASGVIKRKYDYIFDDFDRDKFMRGK